MFVTSKHHFRVDGRGRSVSDKLTVRIKPTEPGDVADALQRELLTPLFLVSSINRKVIDKWQYQRPDEIGATFKLRANDDEETVENLLAIVRTNLRLLKDQLAGLREDEREEQKARPAPFASKPMRPPI